MKTAVWSFALGLVLLMLALAGESRRLDLLFAQLSGASLAVCAMCWTERVLR